MVRHTGEHFINEERIAVTSMLSFQSLRVESTKLNALQSDGFVADCDASFSQKIFDISVAQVEAIVQPDCIADDIGWESVTFISIHPEIIHFRELSCQYHLDDYFGHP